MAFWGDISSQGLVWDCTCSGAIVLKQGRPAADRMPLQSPSPATFCSLEISVLLYFWSLEQVEFDLWCYCGCDQELHDRYHLLRSGRQQGRI